MPFRPLRPSIARWRPVEGEGLDHLDIRPVEAGILARSVVIGAQDGAPYAVHSTICCDADWRVTAFDIRAMDGRGLSLVSPEAGRWTTPEGEGLPALEGCVDIDLSGTPFTNTLPIRRLGLDTRHGPVELSMLYVSFDTFEAFADGQRYTAIEDGRLYRYEAMDSGFTADLTVDEDGLVVDYPGLFRRL